MSVKMDHHEDGTSQFVFTCGCGGLLDEVELTIPTHQYVAWKSGVHIQNAMPQLTDSDRERFLSGLCDDCWDKWAAELERLMEGNGGN